MSYLVTGATGLLGSSIVDCLLEHRLSVRALVRSEDDARLLRFRGVNPLLGDIRDPQAVSLAAKGCDGVFHCAGMVGADAGRRDEYHAVNVAGTMNVADAVLRWSVPRLVYTSSADTISHETSPVAVDESRTYEPPASELPYVASKCEAERRILELARAEGLPVVVTNPTVMLGAGGKKLSSRGYVLAVARRLMKLVPGGGTNFVDVRDVAIGHLHAMMKGVLGQRYIMGNVNMTYRDFCSLVADVMGLSRPVAILPRHIPGAVARIADRLQSLTSGSFDLSTAGVAYVYRYHYVSCWLAREQLGLPQHPLVPAILNTIEWLRCNGLV